MLNYTCDVCGGPMPDKYIRPKSYPGKLATQCRVYEVCPACEAAGRGVDIREVLLAAWRESHGMGCLQAVAERTRGAVTDDMLRELLGVGLKLSIADYRRIGRALDRLEGTGDE